LFGRSTLHLSPRRLRPAMRTILRPNKHHPKARWASHRRQPRPAMLAPRRIRRRRRTTHRAIKRLRFHRPPAFFICQNYFASRDSVIDQRHESERCIHAAGYGPGYGSPGAPASLPAFSVFYFSFAGKDAGAPRGGGCCRMNPAFRPRDSITSVIDFGIIYTSNFRAVIG
jgi:hypothetical protein